jgi:hypothetical protein
MASSVIGWTSCWTSPYSQVSFTEDRRKALVERIRQRKYNFTYDAHQTLPYAAPFYNDNVLCALTKEQWDSVMNEAYGDTHRGTRLTPMDILTTRPKNDVLYEKEKFIPKDGEDNV